jgi:hypothetical protein
VSINRSREFRGRSRIPRARHGGWPNPDPQPLTSVLFPEPRAPSPEPRAPSPEPRAPRHVL